MDGHWALDELDRTVGCETLATKPGPYAGGEWDYLLSLPKRTLRRLRGARRMTRGGVGPDQLAELIIGKVHGIETTDDAMVWYVRASLVAIGEARREAHRRRHLDVARRTGHKTYYGRRVDQARRLGYPSLYAMRKAKGWE